MGFLDKLKPQPRWKHADPSIRLEALKELEDPVELGLLAESDPDPWVRRAAVVRVVDANILGRLARSDSDAETRERALDRLVAFACRADRSTDDPDDMSADALVSVRQIADQRRGPLTALPALRSARTSHCGTAQAAPRYGPCWSAKSRNSETGHRWRSTLRWSW